jgi:hypothetical protein
MTTDKDVIDTIELVRQLLLDVIRAAQVSGDRSRALKHREECIRLVLSETQDTYDTPAKYAEYVLGIADVLAPMPRPASAPSSTYVGGAGGGGGAGYGGGQGGAGGSVKFP